MIALIVDREDRVSTGMADDGKGGSIQIPSYLIGKHDGKSLKEAIHEMEMPEIKKASEDKKKENEALDSLADQHGEIVNVHKNRDFVNDDEANREEHYKNSGHQVMIQAVIGGKIGKRDTVNIDLWYNNAYELFAARWKLRDFAKMQDVFHRHVKVQFQPRSLFRKGSDWPEMVTRGQCILDGKYCFNIGEVYAGARRNDSENQDHDFRGEGLSQQVARE